jgi:hypothetical protein
LSPTLGFEYMIGAHFSIGGEAEWYYLDLEGENSDIYYGSTYQFEQKSHGTDTHLIVRYRF